MRSIRLAALILVGLLLIGPMVDAAWACPMCKEATETDSRLPQAYMFSILFMLAVPASIFTGFGIGFYRLSKQPPREEIDETADDEQ